VKILHYCDRLSRNAGGLYYSVSGLALAEKAIGAEVTVVGGADDLFASDAGQWQDLDLRPFPATSRYSLHSRALALFVAEKPDIVHLHGIWSASSLYGHLAGWRGKRTVVSPHGMLDPWIVARRPVVKGIHAALFEHPLLRRSFVHALNEAERAATLRFEPSIGDRIFVLPNGVPDLPQVSARQRSGALFLSRLHAKKQVVELIQHWQRNDSFNGEKLTVAGWGDPVYEQAVREVIGRSPNIAFAGSLYGSEKASAFVDAKFFILPSLSEGLPMAVLEALSAGCVPIITDQCNLPELFDAGVAIRMATDFSDFPAVMQACLAMTQGAHREMSHRARDFASRYSWTDIARGMLARYEAIVSHGRIEAVGTP
jgi:glycosyltransferase involved in cell wall biosynthesis